MVTLTIDVDEATDRALRVDKLADELEAGNEEYLKTHLERSTRDFAEGRVVDWETVKSRFNL